MRLLWVALLGCLCVAPAHAALRLGAPFGDHMVLARDVPVTIWGTGAPAGDTVRIAIAGQTAVGKSDWSGRWMVQLKPMHAGGPFQMNVAIGGTGAIVPSSAANSTGGLELNDVLVGDVISIDTKLVAAAPEGDAPVSLHPYAFVRVYDARGGAGGSGAGEGPHWVVVRQDRVPAGVEPLFAAGLSVYRKTHIPLGVVGVAASAPCNPSTACSAH